MEDDTSARKKPGTRRRASFWTYPITNFYPGYGDSDGRLDRIEPIAAVSMQRILPRYDLSTSRTRTTGLGPALLEGPAFALNPHHRERPAEDKDDTTQYFEDDETGQIIDVDA